MFTVLEVAYYTMNYLLSRGSSSCGSSLLLFPGDVFLTGWPKYVTSLGWTSPLGTCAGDLYRRRKQIKSLWSWVNTVSWVRTLVNTGDVLEWSSGKHVLLWLAKLNHLQLWRRYKERERILVTAVWPAVTSLCFVCLHQHWL